MCRLRSYDSRTAAAHSIPTQYTTEEEAWALLVARHWHIVSHLSVLHILALSVGAHRCLISEHQKPLENLNSLSQPFFRRRQKLYNSLIVRHLNTLTEISACTTSAVRLYYNIRLWKHQHDVTYQLCFIDVWGIWQVVAGFLILCLPFVAKPFNHWRGTRWILRIELSLRSILHLGPPSSQVSSKSHIPTIGDGKLKGIQNAVISDVEFRSLVNRTETSITTTTQDNGGNAE